MNAPILHKESTGTVCRISKTTIWIALPDCKTTHGCKAGCGSCGGKHNGGKIIPITNSPIKVTLGQLVMVRYFEVNEFLSALIMFGIPLACTLLSLTIWYLVSPATVESGLSLLSAGAAFIAGFLIVKTIDQFMRAKYPATIAVMDDAFPIGSDATPENTSDG